MTTRRSFLQQLSASGLASLCWIAPQPTLDPRARRWAWNDVRLGCVGVGGKGASDMAETSRGADVVAICDVDQQRLAAAAKLHPRATAYADWRRLMDQNDIDAVTVSTPDHMHATISTAAMEQKRHVYTQKPLTNTVAEARHLTELAARQGVVTQMGTQHHSSRRIKQAVQLVQSGTIGKVHEVHAWTDRPGHFWKQGLQRPDKIDPVPDSLDWDLWLGIAPERPFVAGLYHPFHWRGWWDFGTGALGDMGCHLLDPVFTALELGPPRTIEAEGPPPHPESGPLWCEVRYRFAETRWATEDCQVIWYEAGRKPPRERFQAPDDWPGSENGVLMVGERGNVFVGFPEPAQLFPREAFANTPLPEVDEDNHYLQWIAAIQGNGQTSCPFDYAGPLTEAVLLGNVAYRSGQKLNWDSENFTTGHDAADRLLTRQPRSGW